MARRKKRGIFCLETEWEGVQDTASVQPVLRLLSSVRFPDLPYIHRRIATRAGFEHYLKKWTSRRLRGYPILYLGFHGAPGLIYIGEYQVQSAAIPLDELGEVLAGKCEGRVIFFGSCSTLDVHGRRLNAFVRQTGALALLGYESDTDWIDSAAFELLMLGRLQDAQLTRDGMRDFEKFLRSRARGLVKALEFRMVVAK